MAPVDSEKASEPQSQVNDSPSAPTGLEPLLPLNQMLVTQKVDVLDVVSGWEQASKYQIFGPEGQLIYMMEEERNKKGFKMYLRDQNGNGIVLERDKSLLLVKASTTGAALGTVKKSSCCSSEFTVYDGTDTPIFLISPSASKCCMCGDDLPSDVFSLPDTRTPIGEIQEEWTGLPPEVFSEDTENFGISFPADLSVQLKAVLLGACVLIVIDKVPETGRKGRSGDDPKLISDEEWAKRLSFKQYSCTREKATEKPFTGEYLYHKGEGIYACVCCGAELFSSKAKFDSGSGWPSFDSAEANVIRREDRSQGMVRTEILCGRCHAHLGHLFDDGPTKTRERHCVNSASLKFVSKK